ncbi:MAG: hypothetical protein FJ144_15545 [Deltaproteobacteria bacterium]|nr:hypothetical protein [Deltaproteobacteria bacterium]
MTSTTSCGEGELVSQGTPVVAGTEGQAGRILRPNRIAGSDLYWEESPGALRAWRRRTPLLDGVFFYLLAAIVAVPLLMWILPDGKAAR